MWCSELTSWWRVQRVEPYYSGRLNIIKVGQVKQTTLIICPIAITAVLGRALAVVKLTSQVNGKSQFSGSCPQKTVGPMTIKFDTTDYVGEGNPRTKFWDQGVTGFFSPYG